MARMIFEVPETALAALRRSPDEFAKEFRLAAAVKLYEMRKLSQEQAAVIAGLPRADFLCELSRFGVTPFQYDADEIVRESGRR